MAGKSNDVKEDLAFLRGLALEAEAANEGSTFGVIYCAAGLIYGLQCLLTFGMAYQYLPTSGPSWILVGILPTILFLIILFRSILKKGSSPFGISTSNRAINAVFSGAGITSILLVTIFALTAYHHQSWVVWLMFPIVVYALQGGAWFMAAIVRRRIWYGIISAGWFLGAILLGLFVEQVTLYLLILGLFLLLCMAIPGYLIVRSNAERRMPQT